MLNPISLSIVDACTDHVKKAIDNAADLKSKLPEDIFKFGLSNHVNKHFFNNLCDFEDCRYLEVGTNIGASVCSAAYGNNIHAVTFDNFIHHENPDSSRQQLKDNIKKYCDGSVVIFREEDFAKVDKSSNNGMKYNIYYYDGDHSEESTRIGTSYFQSWLCNPCIFVMDDMYYDQVKLGLEFGLAELETHGWIVHRSWRYDNDFSEFKIENTTNWWNGIYIAVIGKES